jgi:hypothetical protein
MILNLHRKKTENIGDLICAPALYFDNLKDAITMDILGWHQGDEPDRDKRIKWKEYFDRAESVIIGGGGLLEIEFFRKAIEYIESNKKEKTKLIMWGAGHNNWEIGDWRKIKQKVSLNSDKYSLIGIRDYAQKYRWVPCSSCMHKLFNINFKVTHDVVLYAHAATIKNQSLRKTLPVDLPVLHNSSKFEDVINFLGSGDLILTDSFHGAYWGTLLGKKVISFASSSKFYDLKHAVPLATPQDWKRFIRMTVKYNEALSECRLQNINYHSDVSNIIGL